MLSLLLSSSDDLSGLLGGDATAGIIGLITALFTGGVSIVFTVIIFAISALSFLIGVAVYIIQAIGIYNCAKRAGHNYAWMAWIPIANMYLVAVLSNREFNIFNFIKVQRRDYVFWGYIVLAYAGNLIVGLISGLFSIIPFIGPLIGALLPTVIAIAVGLARWRLYYDYLCTFGKQENAMVFSIISVFVPLVFSIACFMTRDASPDYGDGNFYFAFNETKTRQASK